MKGLYKVPQKVRILGGVVVLILVVLIGGIVYADNPGTATTTTGQDLIIEILNPQDGGVLACDEKFTVSGRTSIGPLVDEAHVAYVVDESGSTTFVTDMDCDGNGIPGDIGDDFNFNGVNGDILDCEISGVISLNESLFETNTNGSVIGFGSTAALADVGPMDGHQKSTTPLDADNDTNGTPDIEDVLRTMISFWPGNSVIDKFTPFTFGGGTNFDDALVKVHDAFTGVPDSDIRVAFFLSDGNSTIFTTGPGSPLQNLADSGVVINTFSVGNGAAGCGPGDSLGVIADVTGGTCTEVLDPTDLSTALPGVTPTGIDFVEVGVTGYPTQTATLDALGNWSAVFEAPAEGQPYVIKAAVHAEDETVAVADIAVTGGLCATETPTATPTNTPTNTPEPTPTNTPTSTPVPSCDLYPIALHEDTLAGAEPGDILTDIMNGRQPGNFGWLTWTGNNSTPTLITSLTVPGDSHTYINPFNPNDHTVSIDDWVQGRPGVSNAKAVRHALDLLMVEEIVVPIWDVTQRNGANTLYHVTGFANVQITDYHLPRHNRISAEFLGYATCAGMWVK